MGTTTIYTQTYLLFLNNKILNGGDEGIRTLETIPRLLP